MSVQLVNQSTGELSPIAGGTLYADAPVGTIQAYGGATAPTGWMLCQGQAISRTTYAELFAVIGTSFGTGDGSTTFNIPDLRGEFLRGAGTNSHSGQGDGGSVGTHQDATLHVYNRVQSDGINIIGSKGQAALGMDKFIGQSAVSQYIGNTSTASSSTGDYYTSRPTNTSVNYIIKTTSIALPTDFASSVDDAIDAKLEDKRLAKIGRSVPVILPSANITGNSFIPFPYFIAPSKTVVVNFYIPGIMNPTDISCSTTSDLSQGDYCIILTTNSTIIANAGKTCLMTIKSIS